MSKQSQNQTKYKIRTATAPIRSDERLEVSRRMMRNMMRWRERHPVAVPWSEDKSEDEGVGDGEA